MQSPGTKEWLDKRLQAMAAAKEREKQVAKEQEVNRQANYNLNLGREVNTSGKGDDPSTGTYDFGPRIGKISIMDKYTGKPATREEALQAIMQLRGEGKEGGATGLGSSIAEAEQKRQQENAEFFKHYEGNTYLKDTMRDLAPMAMFPMLSRTGFIRGIGGAAAAGAAGGQIGELADKATGGIGEPDDFVSWLGRRGSDAAWGATTELGGRAVGGALRGVGRVPRRILGGAMQDAPTTLRENVAKGYGIHFTPSQTLDEFSAATGKPAGTIIRGEESRAFHNPYSRSIAQSGARERGVAAKATVTGLINELGPDVPSNITGSRMAEVIQRVGKPTWQRQVEKLKSIVNAKARGVMVETAPLKDAAKADLDELGHKLVGMGQVDEDGNPLWPSTAKVRMLREVMAFPDQMEFSNLASKRTDWMSVSPQMTELISGEAKGTAKHFTQIATEMLDEAAKPSSTLAPAMGPAASASHNGAYQQALATWKSGHGGVSPQTPAELSAVMQQAEAIRKAGATPTVRRAGFEQEWNRFRNFTRKGADVFESQVITDAVNKNPEEVLRLVKGDDITDVLRVRRAIKGYGEMYGDVADKVKAAAAWKKFQVGYLRENVLGPLDGDMTRLSTTLDKMTPAVKKAIFDDPASQATLLRLTQVGKALQDADKNLGVLMGHQDPLADLNSQKGWIRSIRPYVVAKLAWNPTATRFFLRGLAGLADAPPSDSKIKDIVSQVLVGKGAKLALKGGGLMTNRRLGAAMADIIRAYDIANIYDESKRQEKRADEFIHKAATGKTTSVPELQPQ